MSTEIHRLLDEAFAGVEMTAEAQDLKEEIRANLLARAAELEADGSTSAAAARRAVAELGDVRELLSGQAPPNDDLAAIGRRRVRPKPGFVVRVTIWGLLAAAGLSTLGLALAGVLVLPLAALIATVGLTGVAAGLVVGDSLVQETTTNHPMPARRAGGYGAATTLAIVGIALVALVLRHLVPLPIAVLAAAAAIAAIVVFALLGATQTNRHKAWVRRLQHHDHPGSRFEREPETAARFGVYTVAIWLVTFAAMVTIGFTVGWWWAVPVFVAGLAAMMLLLARMLFSPPKDR